MYSLKLLFSISIFAFAKASVDDCTVTKVDEIPKLLEKCDDIQIGDLTVPATGPLPVFNLNGKNLTINGKLSFEPRYDDSQALLTITGRNFFVKNGPNGVIDGQGALYWDGKGILSDRRKPLLVNIDQAKKGHFQSLLIKNCPQTCAEVSRSNDIVISGLNVDVSDGDKDGLAVDTHGLSFVNSSAIDVKNIRIINQGACLLVKQGDSIKVFSVQCIGSEGAIIRPDWTYANHIGNISLEYVFLTRTQAGIRIQTSPHQPSGVIKDVTFLTTQVADTKFRGIDITQDYGDEGHPASNIKITNLNIKTVTGYMTDKYVRAVYINCGNGSCSDWHWSGVNIKKAQVENSCNYIPKGFDCW